MISDIDYLISFFEKNTKSSKFDIDEQNAAATTSSKPVKKWESGRTFGKTYMNDPKYVWTSGRVMGKTGGSDFT
jgi:hypothetical protein